MGGEYWGGCWNWGERDCKSVFIGNDWMGPLGCRQRLWDLFELNSSPRGMGRMTEGEGGRAEGRGWGKSWEMDWKRESGNMLQIRLGVDG